MSGYRTIVADPPWAYQGTGTTLRDGKWESKTLPYPTMTVAEIAALPVRDIAADDAHLYLWTTNRYLEEAYGVARAWGFRPVKPLVWCKQPMGFMGGSFTSSVEFILFCRRGNLGTTGKAGRQWWEWPRGAHSAKPEVFQDIVESVSPGPYLELFARRQRIGWHVWGNEVESDVEMVA